jgi:hypothetical protein
MASAVTVTAWPRRRLMAAATASANAVLAGDDHPSPALAVRHHNVR